MVLDLFTFIAVTPELPVGTHSAPAGMRLNNGTDLRQLTILSKGDWDRIQSQLNRGAIEEEKMRKIKEEKDRLRSLNKDQIKNWTNTIDVSKILQLYRVPTDLESQGKSGEKSSQGTLFISPNSPGVGMVSELYL